MDRKLFSSFRAALELSQGLQNSKISGLNDWELLLLELQFN